MQGITAAAGSMNTYQNFLLVPWAMGGTMPLTPPAFQLIVGIYMIETGVLLAAFLNGIAYGEDPVGLRQSVWTTVLFGNLMYIVSWFITYSMFGGTIAQILNPV